MSEHGVIDLLKRFKYLNEQILTFYEEDLEKGDNPHKVYQKILKNNLSNSETPEKIIFTEIKELIKEIEERSSSTDFVVGYLQDYGWSGKTARRGIYFKKHSKL